MRPEQFQSQMNRLVEQFGKNAYGTERCKLLWNEVQNLDLSWFTQVVDRFIGECRQAPLMPEFREEIAKERERLWKIEKKKHAKEAKEFFNSSYQPDDVSNICQVIIKRMQGQVDDTDYAGFQKMLNYAASNGPKIVQMYQCRQCEGSGLIFQRDQEGYEYVYRCYCSAGERQPQPYPLFNQQPERRHHG